MTKLILNIESSASELLIRTLIKRIKGVHIVSSIEKCDNQTEDFINKFSGAWNGAEAPETIISNIKSMSGSKKPVSFD